MPKQQHNPERAPLLDIYNPPTGVQDSTYPDEPDWSDLANNEVRDAAADVVIAMMKKDGFRPGPPDDGDPGDENDTEPDEDTDAD